MTTATTVQHGDNVIIDGRRCYVGTVAGYAEEYAEDAAAAVARAVAFKQELHWIGLHATVLCADRGYYDREAAKFARAQQLHVGDEIAIDDSVHGVIVFIIGNAPNRNFALTRKVVR